MQMLIWDNHRLSADEKTLQDYLHLTNPFKIKPDFLLHWYDERFGEFKKWSSSVVQFGFILWFGVICKCPFSAKYISMTLTGPANPSGGPYGASRRRCFTSQRQVFIGMLKYTFLTHSKYSAKVQRSVKFHSNGPNRLSGLLWGDLNIYSNETSLITQSMM